MSPTPATHIPPPNLPLSGNQRAILAEEGYQTSACSSPYNFLSLFTTQTQKYQQVESNDYFSKNTQDGILEPTEDQLAILQTHLLDTIWFEELARKVTASRKEIKNNDTSYWQETDRKSWSVLLKDIKRGIRIHIPHQVSINQLDQTTSDQQKKQDKIRLKQLGAIQKYYRNASSKHKNKLLHWMYEQPDIRHAICRIAEETNISQKPAGGLQPPKNLSEQFIYLLLAINAVKEVITVPQAIQIHLFAANYRKAHEEN